jgi:HEAT repeat protein
MASTLLGPPSCPKHGGHLCLIAAFVFSVALGFAVPVARGAETVPAPNAVYFELLGNGFVYTLNYERMLTNHLGVRFGGPPPATPPEHEARPAADLDASRIAQLIAGLNDDVKETRDRSQQDLVKIGGPAVPELIAALEDTEMRVRVKAAEALGSIKDPRPVEALVELFGDPSRELWAAVYGALARIGPPAVPALLEALESSDWARRWKAVHLLGEIRDPAAVAVLVALLNKDRSTGVRVEIAAALGRIKDRDACNALLAALHDW